MKKETEIEENENRNPMEDLKIDEIPESEFIIPRDSLPLWHKTTNVEFQAKLPIKLSEAELYHRGLKMSQLIRQMNEKELAKAQMSSELGAQIKVLKSQINELGGIIEKGIEEQNRGVVWKKDYDNNKRVLVLVDENLIVGFTDFLTSDYQTDLIEESELIEDHQYTKENGLEANEPEAEMIGEENASENPFLEEERESFPDDELPEYLPDEAEEPKKKGKK